MIRRRDKSSDMLPDYKRFNPSAKPQKHLTRNLAIVAGVCVLIFLFIRSSELTASLGISAPTKHKGPRGFTSGLDTTAHTKQPLLEQHGEPVHDDDGSYIVDTTHAGGAAAGGHHELGPASAVDAASLHGKDAPKFVGDELVDPLDHHGGGDAAAATGAEAHTDGSGGSWAQTHPHGVYSLSAVDIDGRERSLQEFAGKVTVFVNVASKCGYTDANYKGLQQLYEKYKSSGLEVLAFPSNQFGQQEPGSDAEIKLFATRKYRTTFPLFSKIDVNGPNTHPVYRYMKSQLNIEDPPGLPWNFQKILVNRAGKPVLHLQADWDQSRVEHAVYNLLVSAAVQ